MLEYYGSELPALPVDALENIFVACNTSCDGLSRQLLAVDTSDEAKVAFGHYVIGAKCRRDVPVSIGPSSECVWTLLSTCGMLPRMRIGSFAFRRARVDTPPSLLQGQLQKACC